MCVLFESYCVVLHECVVCGPLRDVALCVFVIVLCLCRCVSVCVSVFF